MKKTLPAILLILLCFFAPTASGVFLEEHDSLITLNSENEPVSKILKTLSNRYSIEIDYGNARFNRSISIKIRKQPLERIISRLLQITDVRNFVIYYDSSGNMKRIHLLKTNIAGTERKHGKLNQRVFRRTQNERLPPIPPDLPEPPARSEYENKQPTNIPHYLKTEEIPSVKTPFFVPSRRARE